MRILLVTIWHKISWARSWPLYPRNQSQFLHIGGPQIQVMRILIRCEHFEQFETLPKFWSLQQDWVYADSNLTICQSNFERFIPALNFPDRTITYEDLLFICPNFLVLRFWVILLVDGQNKLKRSLKSFDGGKYHVCPARYISINLRLFCRKLGPKALCLSQQTFGKFSKKCIKPFSNMILPLENLSTSYSTCHREYRNLPGWLDLVQMAFSHHKVLL